MSKRSDTWIQEHPFLAAIPFCFLSGTLAVALSIPYQHLLGWGCIAGIVLLAVGFLIGSLRKQLGDTVRGALIWGMGYFLRLGFILRTPYYTMQHDVNRFTDADGHAGYMMYLFREGHLPDSGIRETWQFYHPPLHHLLEAGWMHLMTALGMETELVYESSQILPFTYSCLSLTVFGMLLKHFDVKGLAFSLMMGIMAFHPTFIILSGSINNDMLSILLMMLALLLTCRWYREQKLSTILQLALAIGCGMMAKLSAWMAAPAAAMIFLVILVKNRKQPFPYLRQYVMFGGLCVPLGLWWGIRNLIRFGVPITYIPLLSEDSSQYVGNIPVWQRLLDISPKQFTYIYDNFVMYGQSYNEYNPLIGLLKTAVFEEFVNTDRYPGVIGTGEVLFWVHVLLAGLALWGMVRVCKTFSVPDDTEQLALLLTYAITLVSYIGFCLTYPHTCTQSIRYATPVIYVSLLFLGIYLRKAPMLFRRTAAVLSCIFMAGSFLIYGILLYIPAG